MLLFIIRDGLNNGATSVCHIINQYFLIDICILYFVFLVCILYFVFDDPTWTIVPQVSAISSTSMATFPLASPTSTMLATLESKCCVFLFWDKIILDPTSFAFFLSLWMSAKSMLSLQWFCQFWPKLFGIKSYLVIMFCCDERKKLSSDKSQNNRIVKEVIRSDGLWRIACSDVFIACPIDYI